MLLLNVSKLSGHLENALKQHIYKRGIYLHICSLVNLRELPRIQHCWKKHHTPQSNFSHPLYVLWLQPFTLQKTCLSFQVTRIWLNYFATSCHGVSQSPPSVLDAFFSAIHLKRLYSHNHHYPHFPESLQPLTSLVPTSLAVGFLVVSNRNQLCLL